MAILRFVGWLRRGLVDIAAACAAPGLAAMAARDARAPVLRPVPVRAPRR